MSVYKMLANVVNKKISVSKTGRNELQKYDYVEIAELKEVVNNYLAAEGLIYFGNTLEVIDRVIDTKNGQAKITRVKVLFTLIDPNTVEKIELTYFGDGMDSGDKGIYKAYTGAEKYFLIQTFRIATGDDAEKENTLIILEKIVEQIKNINKSISTTGEIKAIPEALPVVTPKLTKPTGAGIKGILEKISPKKWGEKNLTEYSIVTETDKKKVTIWDIVSKKVEMGDMVIITGVTEKVTEKYGTQYLGKNIEKIDFAF